MTDDRIATEADVVTTLSPQPVHDTAAKLTAMIFAVAIIFIDQAIVSIAAPTIQHDLGLSASGMQWAINAYLLTLAALFAFGGRNDELPRTRDRNCAGLAAGSARRVPAGGHRASRPQRRAGPADGR
jgi:hypothetical protein